MPNLLADVIISDILTRVPVKTVARSKSVCKEWHALLSTRDFEKAHCSRTLIPSNQRTLLLRDLNYHHTDELLLWNPTTGAHKLLTTPAGDGLYKDIADIVGLYNGASNDYRLLHLSRRSDLLSAHVYSRQLGSWRKIAFRTNNPEYQKRRFYWSTGTVCGDTLYFTVYECWVVGKNVVVGFDPNTEQVAEISFPSTIQYHPLGFSKAF
ncbi:putative F-box-like domain superfamily protein [Helianthus anomalus]